MKMTKNAGDKTKIMRGRIRKQLELMKLESTYKSARRIPLKES